MDTFLIEDCIFLIEDYTILYEANLFSKLQDKLSSLSISDMKNKILDYKQKADDKLLRLGFSKKFIDQTTSKLANSVKNKIHINNVSDANKKNANMFIKKMSKKIKNELKNNADMKSRFGELKFIASVIALFIVSVMGTISLIITIKGILLLPIFWFFMTVIYQLLINKYLSDYDA